jgi:hypothetical protein
LASANQDKEVKKGEVKTDASGKAELVYTSCEVSGLEAIEASVELVDGIDTNGIPIKNGRPLKNIAVVTVAVPGLRPLTGTSSIFILAGDTTHHPVGTNHFALPETNTRIFLMALDYVQATSTATSSRLQINDMDLQMGGLFDIDGDWRPTSDDCIEKRGKGHCLHRRGTSVDINGEAIVVGQTGTKTAVDKELLKSIIQKPEINGCRIEETPIHIEFDTSRYNRNQQGWCRRR